MERINLDSKSMERQKSKPNHDFHEEITINEKRILMKDNRVGFFAGLAGGFGFYIAWMILAMVWQTTTSEAGWLKSGIGFVLGLVVGVLLYLGVYAIGNKKREAATRKPIIRYALLGIVAGLVVAFLFGLLFYNPTGLWPTPIFPLG